MIADDKSLSGLAKYIAALFFNLTPKASHREFFMPHLRHTPVQKINLSYFQHTLGSSFSCMGRGLHTGIVIIMTVMPAEANTGYRFIRSDVPVGRNEVLATWHTVSDSHLCTTVSNNMGIRVSTIEHLIAALHACGVDNARIVLDGPEVPIMDGSAKPFVELINSVGLSKQQEERMAIIITKEVIVRDGIKQASLSPSPVPCVEGIFISIPE